MIGIILFTQKRTDSRLSATSFLRCAILALASVCLIASPLFHASTLPLEQAHAATWPLGSSQASVSTAFHQEYSYNGKTLTHSGLDIPAKAGSDVVAPVSGTVSFVGNVPAGDTYLSKQDDGKTMRAASILMRDGKTVTLMPLEKITVSKGEALSEGKTVGTLAAAGDRSSSESHLHIGLKKDGIYYDPAELFPVLAKKAKNSQMNEGTVALDANPAKETKDAALQPVQAKERAPSVSLDSAEAFESIGAISSGTASWNGQPESEETGVLDGVVASASSVVHACSAQLSSLQDGIEGLSRQVGVPSFVLSTFLFAVLILLTAAALRALTLMLSTLRAALKREKNGALYRVFGGGIIP